MWVGGEGESVGGGWGESAGVCDVWAGVKIARSLSHSLALSLSLSRFLSLSLFMI